ncbi:MAG: LacI family DNA-binding transcriptional regulator [Paracoccaceae bacterium]|jgi:LacI family transcriptional regulator|nr:LacI family DNA-binding transcriptional regulator [Rhodobacterales bacterium FZCC0083]
MSLFNKMPKAQKDRLVSHTPLPTLQDVADLAAVSTATVSRCLNNSGHVTEKTRLKVQQAIQTLGYSPNFGAQALAAKRTNTIGAIIPTMENAIFARGIQAFQETLAENGITLIIASCSYRPELEEEQIRSLVARGADALLLIGQSRPAATYQFLARRNIPYVLAWAHKKDSQHCYIGFDNQAAAQTITRQVLELGHRNLGVIVGLTRNNDRARDRITGIEHAIADYGAQTAPLQVIEAEYTFQEGAKALDQLLANPTPPTAVICGNDVLAVGAVKRAKQLGLAVPEDLSITGFADIEVSELIDPELTTVHVPHREMGIAAAKSLIAMLKTQTPVESHLLETRIVNRQSLGPAKPH